jgi:DNA processing protein
MKIVIKILFTILLTIKKKNHIFHLQIFSMTDQDLFYLLALQSVEGVGDIMAKKNYLPIVVRPKLFKTKVQQLAGIDGVGANLLKNVKDQTVFEKANKELEFIKANAVKVAHFQSDDYPALETLH